MGTTYVPVIQTNFTGVSASLVTAEDADNALTVKVDDDTFNQLEIQGNGRIELGGGDAPPDVALFRDGSVRLHTINDFVTEGNLVCESASKGLNIKEGVNARMGVSTLVGGTVTVANATVSANSRIFLTVQSLGTVTSPKAVAVTAINAGVSFVITSADPTDTSVVAWMFVKPS